MVVLIVAVVVVIIAAAIFSFREEFITYVQILYVNLQISHRRLL